MAIRKVYQKTNFLGGEAGFYLEGRSDLAQYAVGCSKLQNFVGLPGGGAARRPPTNFVKGTLNNNPATLIPFLFSNSESFVLSLSHEPSTPETEAEVINNSSLAVETTTIAVPLAGTELFPEDNLKEIQYAQSADVLFLANRGGQPLTVSRNSANDFLIDTYNPGPVAALSLNNAYVRTPYRQANINTTHTLTPSATTGAITITSSASFFNSGHVGAYFRIVHGATIGYAIVTGYTSDTLVNAFVHASAPFGAASASSDWSEAAWSDYRGWPRTVTIYNQRLVFGGNESQPDTIWASEVGDFFQMHTDGSFAISNALSFTLASNRLNEINWMLGGKKLTIGTSGSEWVGEFIEEGTNLRVQFEEETTYGSKYIQAQKVGGSIPFVQRSGRKIRELFFSEDESNYKAIDLTIFASHVGQPFGRFVNSNTSLTRIAQQESPFNVLWAIDSVGRMWSLTRDRDQQIATWCSHQIGGVMTEFVLTGLSGPDYPSLVTSICAVPSPDNTHDRIFLVVRRVIDGVDSYHIEYIGDFQQQSTLGAEKCHLDSSVRVTGAANVTWSGFSHLADTEAYAVAIGPVTGGSAIVYVGPVDVNGAGEITLPHEATDVRVGILQSAEARTLPLDNGGQPEVLGGAIRRPDQMVLRLHQSFGVKVGEARKYSEQWGTEENDDGFDFIPMGNTQTMFVNSKIFTGIIKLSPPGDFSRESAIAIKCDTPWPCTLLSMDLRMVVNEV